MTELERKETEAMAAAVDPPAADESAKPDPLRRLLWDFISWSKDITIAILAAMLIILFVVQPVKVEGTSMLPRLVDQERIFINRFIYHFSDIQRGDIVVFRYPKEPAKSFIKRVIGLPGEWVMIEAGKVFLNGRPLEEFYLDPRYIDHDTFGPRQVPPDSYFVLGDHRNSSNDSRSWGFVPIENIYGKAIFRYWPISRLGSIQ